MTSRDCAVRAAFLFVQVLAEFKHISAIQNSIGKQPNSAYVMYLNAYVESREFRFILGSYKRRGEILNTANVVLNVASQNGQLIFPFYRKYHKYIRRWLR
ncbi:hypothetical protein TTRE_0000206601 [Trichuris trichiura]|uniref:Uncharacterized protein n=1 Tax=Trichuris trichiura TaxID=36087 RepID=A0A077Z1L0_TRITR|nr:hypothetical protein TTRE_0000206601 [Trichuris trichiura]